MALGSPGLALPRVHSTTGCIGPCLRASVDRRESYNRLIPGSGDEQFEKCILEVLLKFNVVHISDIHFHSKDDPAYNSAEEIAAKCFYRSRESDATLIAVTGDVAFSGSKEQYQTAHSFFTKISDCISNEIGRPVYLIFCPGNHDCVLKPENDVRELVIGSIMSHPHDAIKPTYIETCVSVQNNYFDFINDIENPKPIYEHPLWREYVLKVGEKSIRISSLNIAWMSRLPEKAGTLVYPLEMFQKQLAESTDIRLVLMHQPYNWQQQKSYHEMRTHLRRNSSAVLSGHEHTGVAGKIDDDLTGASLYFECSALQPHGSGEAGFAMYTFDLSTSKVIVQRFSLMGNSVQEKDTDYILDLPSVEANRADYVAFKKTWQDDLDNPGANFLHPDKSELKLDDIFVYPDLRDWENDKPGVMSVLSSEALANRAESGESALVLGDERAGKTTLLYKYAKKLRQAGKYPLYVKASELSNVKGTDDLPLRFGRAEERQYENYKLLRDMPKSQRVLLIDDIDRFKSGVNAIPHLLNYAKQHFGSVILTAGQSFEVSSLTSATASEMLREYPKYEILRFGKKLRLRLIKKWCSLAQVTTKAEFDARVHQIESVLNSVIGKNLVPQLPIYLLILLQSSDQHQHGEIQNSGFSHYYQFLITKSLGQAGVGAQELNEYYNYLAHLTWYMHSRTSREINIVEFREFNSEFSDRFSYVDVADRISKLIRARLISQRGDCYSFAYPYVYYFFFGKYLASRVHKDSVVKDWITNACSKLYLRENANAILFLTHHENDPWIIEKIADVVRECFSEVPPMHFNGDTCSINTLIENVTEQVLLPHNVEKYQEEARDKSDAFDVSEESKPEPEPDANGELDFVAKYTLLFKTSEILGQILKNYYGSLEKPFKASLLREVFNGPLRALGLQLGEISKDLDGFVAYIDSVALKDDTESDKAERERKARRFAANFLGWLGTSVVSAASLFVATDKLRDDISVVVEKNPTAAYRLIEIGTRLVRPGAIPLKEIEKLAKELKDNPFALQILQSLGMNHLYLFHTSVSEKNKLCNILKISISNAKQIESQGRDLKLVSNRKAA